MKNVPIKKNVRTVLISFIITIAVQALDHSGGLIFFERKHYDFFQNLIGKRTADLKTVIVAIDDQSLMSKKDEPLVFWGPYFAKAVEVLKYRGAEAIGIDFLFAVSAESWLKKIGVSADAVSRTYDIPFRQQLESGTVILVSLLSFSEKGKVERIIPPFDYWAVMPGLMNDIGIANLSYDADGVCRKFETGFEGIDPPDLSFPSVLVLKYLHRRGDTKKAEALEEMLKEKKEHLTGFVGPPGTIKRISFRKLLQDDAMDSEELEIVKDSIVIIAEENSGSQDIHQTPYALDLPGFSPRMMTGAELHANIVESLVSGKYPVSVEPALKLVLVFVTVFSVSIILQILTAWYGIFFSFLLILVYNIIAYRLFCNYRIISSAGVEAGTVILFLAFFALRYSGSEASRKKIQKMFGRYVSDEIVEKLVESGMEPALGGSLKRVTVLFSDIRDFTTISESLSPEETVEMLNEYFGRICAVILDYGGTVDKFIGDAVMAVFGAPVEMDDHACKALKSALGMTGIACDFNHWVNKRFVGKCLPEFRIGIGVHTGNALVGNIGSPRRIEYTAIGDTVNTASRIEGITKEFGWTLAVSSEAIESIKTCSYGFLEHFCIGSSRDIVLKGKSESITLYEVKQTCEK